MPTCHNCGNENVTSDYARVFSRREDGDVDCCPDCPDKVRTHTGKIRNPRATRRKGGDHSHERDEGTKEP